MWTWSLDFWYLTQIVTKLEPIMDRALPLLWTAIVLNWIYKLITK